MSIVSAQREHTVEWLELNGTTTSIKAPVSTGEEDGSVGITYGTAISASCDWQPYKPDTKRVESGDIIIADYMLFSLYDLAIGVNYLVERVDDTNKYRVVAIKDYPDHKEVYILNTKGARYDR